MWIVLNLDERETLSYVVTRLPLPEFVQPLLANYYKCFYISGTLYLYYCKMFLMKKNLLLESDSLISFLNYLFFKKKLNSWYIKWLALQPEVSFWFRFLSSATFVFAKTTSTVFQTRNLDLVLTLSCHNWFCLDTIVTLMHFSIHEPAFFQRPLITDKNALNSWTYIEVFCISLSMSVTMWD